MRTLLLSLFILPAFIRAQVLFTPIGAEAWGKGGCSTASENIWAINNNVAGICSFKNTSFGINNQVPFKITELSLSSLALVAPTKWVHTGFSLDNYGNALFNQQKISLGLAKLLSKTFSIGISLDYVHTQIQGYGNSGTFVPAGGVLYKPHQKLHIGLKIFNPNQIKYSENITDKIPTYARLGLLYKINNHVQLLVDADKTLQKDMIMRCGIDYEIHPSFSLRAGWASNPMFFTFGFALSLKKLRIDFASSIHEVLGLTPHLALVYQLK